MRGQIGNVRSGYLFAGKLAQWWGDARGRCCIGPYRFLLGRWFAGRVGVYRNLAPENSRPVYTGGVAFGIGQFAIDLAIGAAADRVRLDSSTFGDSVPNGFAAAIQFSWRPKPPAS